MKTAAHALYLGTFIAWVLIVFPAVYLFMTGDYSGPSAFYGLQEDDEFVSFIFTAREMLNK